MGNTCGNDGSFGRFLTTCDGDDQPIAPIAYKETQGDQEGPMRGPRRFGVVGCDLRMAAHCDENPRDNMALRAGHMQDSRSETPCYPRDFRRVKV
jgi:hypothetical protein